MVTIADVNITVWNFIIISITKNLVCGLRTIVEVLRVHYISLIYVFQSKRGKDVSTVDWVAFILLFIYLFDYITLGKLEYLAFRR